MSTARFEYQHESGIVARWHGGAYIDLGSYGDAGAPGIDGDDFHAYDVINVWDYATDEPRIARTLEAFQTRVDEKLAEDAAEDDA